MSDDQFLAEFAAGRIPLEDWHHRKHIRLAYLYLNRYPFAEAMDRMRTGLQKFIAAHNVPDSPTSGYHETMTRAWMQLVDVTLREYGPADSSDIFCDQHPQLMEKKALRLFYSRDLLMSPEAKREFVELDLAPLPIARKK